MPVNCNNNLHKFTYEHAANLNEEAYCYDPSCELYLFWANEGVGDTASSFSAGHLALVGVGGALVGILGTAITMGLTRKKKEEHAPTSVTA